MHGNLHALTANPFSLNRAAADTRLTLWLAFPTARAHFDPSTLSEADRARLAGAHGARRRADFEVSRALLAIADVGSAAHSMSHSAEHAALLIAPTGSRIGVDLEINRARDVLRLARFAFDEREVSALESAAPESRQALFYTLWTLKESFAKALQLNLVDALRHCVFWTDDGEWRGRVPTASSWSAAVFQPRPDIFIAAARIGASEAMQLNAWEWPPKQLANWPVMAACAAAPSDADAAPV
ncbi:4'-phosphopantetheinyl transferase family protein [Steroidobacter flavus]|uniref:4'-phosphopantetheinyl transferase family protein n=1 Tax=Steroidobacter flavus TaxID=1842136 RepID=A0ABV8SV25_9GAMM